MGSGLLDKDGKSIAAADVDKDYIVNSVKDVLKQMPIDPNGNWDKYCDALYDCFSPIYDDIRLDMVKLLAKRVNALVSDLELHNDKYYGTLHTLDELSKSFDDIYFVMGADNLLHLDKWINYETLLDKYNFIVFTRDDIDCEKVIDEKFQKYKDHFLLYPLHIDVSSTMIRDNIEENKELLLDEIYEYIKEKGLYEVK